MQTQPSALRSPNPDFKIRPVRSADVPILHDTCWADRPPESVEKMISRAQYLALQGRGLGVVVKGGDDSKDLLGFGLLSMWSRCAEISDLIVVEDKRGGGIGTAMIQYLVRVASDMHVPCVEIGAAKSNPRALSLYQRLGFQSFKTINLDIGAGLEPIVYLRLKFPKK